MPVIGDSDYRLAIVILEAMYLPRQRSLAVRLAMIISKTPLRACFSGDGTDIRDYYKTGYGAVVSPAF